MEEPFIKTARVAWTGTHRHTASGGVDPYVFTYLFKIGIPLTAREATGPLLLTLPDNETIRILAMTLVVGASGRHAPGEPDRRRDLRHAHPPEGGTLDRLRTGLARVRPPGGLDPLHDQRRRADAGRSTLPGAVHCRSRCDGPRAGLLRRAGRGRRRRPPLRVRPSAPRRARRNDLGGARLRGLRGILERAVRHGRGARRPRGDRVRDRRRAAHARERLRSALPRLRRGPARGCLHVHHALGRRQRPAYRRRPRRRQRRAARRARRGSVRSRSARDAIRSRCGSSRRAGTSSWA